MVSKFQKLSKEELIETLELIFETLKNTRNSQSHFSYKEPNDSLFYPDPSKNKNLKTLVGTIPFLLMDEKIFERNQDIANFAKTLDIKIPWPEKKKKEDIIGRIIVSISTFNNRKINELNKAITKISGAKHYTNKNSFFADWDNAIKTMKI